VQKLVSFKWLLWLCQLSAYYKNCNYGIKLQLCIVIGVGPSIVMFQLPWTWLICLCVVISKRVFWQLDNNISQYRHTYKHSVNHYNDAPLTSVRFAMCNKYHATNLYCHFIKPAYFHNPCSKMRMWLRIGLNYNKLEAIQKWSAICRVWPWTLTYQKFLLCVSSQGQDLYTHTKN